MKQLSGRLVARDYSDFRGVDFSNRKDEVSLYRSPDALNMWKNYKNANGKCVETRPDIELLAEYNDTIFGLFFYEYGGTTHRIVHSGTNLYDGDTVIYTDMNEFNSDLFVYNNLLYIKDAKNYLVYDGTTCKEVEGYIPETSIGRSPLGGGTKKNPINLLTPWRINSFVGDGTSRDYYLDSPFDAYVESPSESIEAWYIDANGSKIDLTVGYSGHEAGLIGFNEIPPAPITVGKDNVYIKFKYTIDGSADKILKSTLVQQFDSRVFFSGNPDEPNIVRYSNLNNPEYCPDTFMYPEGTTDSKVKSMVTGNNALWILKEPSQSNTTIYYHIPSYDSETRMAIYPNYNSSISIGTITEGINFNDTICFISNRGLEAITGNVTTEQVLSHRSSLVDSKLLNEKDLTKVILEEWEGYLLLISGNHIYLADSRTFAPINDHTEYEWFYFEINPEVVSTEVKNGVLYLCTKEETKTGIKNRIYTMTNTSSTRKVESYWTTIEDEFNYPQYQKTTNKKGCVVDMEGQAIKVFAKTDRNKFEKINEYKNVKGYVVPRIKEKKWKSLQIKFYSDKPFELYSSTLEAYVGAYVKR